MRLLIIFVLVLISGNLLACSCKRISILKGQKQSDIVFRGKVIQVIEKISNDTIPGTDKVEEYRTYEFVFEINKFFKGKKSLNSTDSITIITTADGADCGSWFDINKKYLVYSYKLNHKLNGPLWNEKTEEFYTTSLCTKTKKNKPWTIFERIILSIT